jgi:putative PIN family toxin of toxin-antitoxin system
VRVLIDSSVLVAAHISRAGVCAELLEDVLMDHELVMSQFIIDELARKLRDKVKFTDDEIAEVRSHLLADSEMVSPVEVPSTACRDPNDLPVLGTAVAGRADVLITVDKDLLDLRAYSGSSIIGPGQFWRRVDAETVPPGPTDDQQA